MQSTDGPQGGRLSPEDLPQIVAVFCEAFREYPVMRYVLKQGGQDYEEQLRDLIGWFTDSRLSRDRTVLAVSLGPELVAGANIDPPQSSPQPDSLRRRWRRLESRLGEAAIGRLNAFDAAADSLKLEEPHTTWECLGYREGASRLFGYGI